MVSFTAKFFALVMQKTDLFRRLPTDMGNFSKFQARLLAKPNVPSDRNRRVCTVLKQRFQGREIWILSPKKRAPSAHVLYWHGGAYLYPPTSAHWDFLARMASVHHWHITVPLYPLAPMAKVDEVTTFALDYLLEWMAQPCLGTRVMAGDSAGGGLAATTLMAARKIGLKLPDKVVLICPWLKLIPANPLQVEIELRDPILSRRGLRAAGELYVGDFGIDDLRANPLLDNWSSLPPILLFGGGDDTLVTDARELRERLPELVYDERKGMIHDWPILFFPESRMAQETMAAFTRH